MIRKEFLLKNNSNKTLLIVAGFHGNEQTSVYAIDELIRNIENKRFTPNTISKIIIYNYVNMNGILTRDRYCNNLDLNREFSDRLSKNRDIEKIKKDAVNSDIIIDVHSSFNSTEFFFLDKDYYTESYIQFFNKLNLAYVVSSDPNINTLKSYINKKFPQKIGLTLELNQDGNNIDIASALKGINIIENLIKNINTFRKFKKLLTDNIDAITLTADITGLLKLNDSLGKIVQRGEKLGYILSFDKTRMVNILAPCEGQIIVYPSYITYISVGDPVLTIQPINK